MNNIKLKGNIIFDPKDITKKHKNQSNWKRIAMVIFDGDICEYYSWFIYKRYNLKLNKPIRRAHISFINDSLYDISKGLKCSELEADKKWNEFKIGLNNWNITVNIDTDIKSDGTHWWLPIKEKDNEELINIRKKIGLNKPYWNLHLSLGYANSRNLDHSKYIVRMINNGISYH